MAPCPEKWKSTVYTPNRVCSACQGRLLHGVKDLLQKVAHAALTPNIAAVFPLARAREAHSKLPELLRRGVVVLQP